MKALHHKKSLGIAVGERSLLIAEVAAGERAQVRRLAEMDFPAGVGIEQSAELGKVLDTFLREKGFESRTVVIGLPLKWLIFKQKEVPPSDPSTLASLLRLTVEAEFSTELKDLVYDFSGHADPASPGNVLLVATPLKHIDWMNAICDAARLELAAVTSSALALGQASADVRTVADSKTSPAGAASQLALSLSIASKSAGDISSSPENQREALVLAVDAGGAELSAQNGAMSVGLRRLRAPIPQPAFVGELRRAMSSLPASSGPRELILWNTADGLDGAALGKQLGLTVENADLETLGVDARTAGMNGESRQFAAATALALAGVGVQPLAVNFLHSRLAPPKKRNIPRWAVLAAAVVVLAIGAGIYAWTNLQSKQRDVDRMQAQLATDQTRLADATAFVVRVSFAQAWHGGDARYLGCLRDLTRAVPEDGQTYATSVLIKENVPAASSSSGSNGKTLARSLESRTLSVTFLGKSSNQQHVLTLVESLGKVSTFKDVKLGNNDVNPRTKEAAFSITMTYAPAKGSH